MSFICTHFFYLAWRPRPFLFQNWPSNPICSRAVMCPLRAMSLLAVENYHSKWSLGESKFFFIQHCFKWAETQKSFKSQQLTVLEAFISKFVFPTQLFLLHHRGSSQIGSFKLFAQVCPVSEMHYWCNSHQTHRCYSEWIGISRRLFIAELQVSCD